MWTRCLRSDSPAEPLPPGNVTASIAPGIGGALEADVGQLT